MVTALIFAKPIETEISSAGTQLTRDRLGHRRQRHYTKKPGLLALSHPGFFVTYRHGFF